MTITLEWHLNSLGLSVRAKNALAEAQICSIRELAAFSAKELSSVRGIGKTVLSEIRLLLNRHGFSLRGDTPSLRAGKAEDVATAAEPGTSSPDVTEASEANVGRGGRRRQSQTMRQFPNDRPMTPEEAEAVLRQAAVAGWRRRYLATWVNRTADLTTHLNEVAATGYRLVTMCAAEVQVQTDQGVRWAIGVRCAWEREGER